MGDKKITQKNLEALVSDLLSGGTRVLAPQRFGTAEEDIDYLPLKAAKDMRLEATLPRRSIKGAFLPPTEVLLRYRIKKSDVELQPAKAEFPPSVVIAARPCDAAGPEILDKLMGWDYKDDLWFGRRAATTIVAMACPGLDDSCFCTAVGLGPDSTRGADILLTPVKDGYDVALLTDKGKKFVGDHSAKFADGGAADEAKAFHAKARERIEKNLKADPKAIAGWLEKHFDDKLWQSFALRCHGCGACASVCPTCHCFDIIDEPLGIDIGERRRNWDTCQTARFTLHGSGHNPRHDQAARYRQRITHKFSIFPKRFQEILCTGCGRCVRACPAGMDLPQILTTLAECAQAEGTRGAA